MSPFAQRVAKLLTHDALRLPIERGDVSSTGSAGPSSLMAYYVSGIGVALGGGGTPATRAARGRLDRPRFSRGEG